MCTCVPACVGMCMVVQASTEVRKGHICPEAEVPGGCQLPDMDAGKKSQVVYKNSRSS